MRALPGPLFLQNDASFFVDLFLKKKHAEGYVGEVKKPFIDGFRLGIRQGQNVGCLIQTRKGILMLAESQAYRFEVRQQLSGREVFRAVKRHVLQEMRHPLLPVFFVERPR